MLANSLTESKGLSYNSVNELANIYKDDDHCNARHPERSEGSELGGITS